MANHNHHHLHFQPWRNCVKTEKSDSVDFFNSSPTTTSSSNNNNPELDTKCIEDGNYYSVGDFAKKQIVQILESISLLKPPERVLLYLRMPGANCETDPLRQPQNPLGARSEINHTINWVRSHLEPDPNVSIPKKDVYDDYTAFCGRNNIKPLSTADFGKVMKQVFPTVRPRRLGTRGHSQYCYAAMRKATKLDPPLLPDLSAPGGFGKGVPAIGIMQGMLGMDSGSVESSSSWHVIQRWAEGLLKTKFECAKDLAEHIERFNLIGSSAVAAGDEAEIKGEHKKYKDKRKEPVATKATAPKKRRKKPRKDSSSASADGGDVSCGEPESKAVHVKKEVDSGNDEDQIIDLKVAQSSIRPEATENRVIAKAPVELMINGVPIDASPSASGTSTEDSLQIENVYCKKVRQAQQAKGLWFQQQQQQQQPPQQQHLSAQSSVIVASHTFSQPEIPSPSMLNQMNQLRQQHMAERESMLPKNGNKREGGGDDAIPGDFILPRERVISLCALDKDALDDYLPLAGDNSQEAEIMEYFDENSSNGPSNGGSENNSPKEDEGSNPGDSHQQSEGGSNSESYPMFANEQQRSTVPVRAVVSGNQDSLKGGGGGGGVPEKLSQLRQMLHINLSQQHLNSTSRIDQAAANYSPGSTAYAGPASASLTLLSQRHNLVNYPPTVGMDLTQESGVAGRPVSLKRRLIPERDDSEDVGQRRFVPIAPPQNFAPAVNYTKMPASRMAATGRYDEFLCPKMAALKKPHSLPIDAHVVRPTASQDHGPMPLLHSAAGPLSGTGLPNGMLTGCVERQTAFSRPKYDRPSDAQEALNMRTFAESRSQSVPLNYRQSPVQQVTPSNDGASWSSSYQNPNNAPSSTCSSVAQTPIPADYNDFTEMINIWENEPVMTPGQATDATGSQSRADQQQGEEGQEKLYKDRNNNNSSSSNNIDHNNEEFLDEMKAVVGVGGGGGGMSNLIVSRSVPSTPLPMGSASYYPKSYAINANSNNGQPGGDGPPSMFSGYFQTRRGVGFDASKSVPTTPIASLANHFRYSPTGEVLNRSRDSLINGNAVGSSAVAVAFGAFDAVRNVADEEAAVRASLAVGGGSSSTRRRIEKIEEDRKVSSVGQKDMSELEEEMSGFDPIMDTDLMNQFKAEF